MEHGNRYRAELPVSVRVLSSDVRVYVQVTDHGGGQPIPKAETPDLEAKLAGRQTPRGWGLFLIEQMVDEVEVTTEADHHTVELRLDLKGGGDGDP
jgi:anti-sigma regulatory factor (Ser/Thr protein kinase)